MMTWIGEYFLGEKLQVREFFWLGEIGSGVKSISTTHQNRQEKDGRLGRVVI